MQRNLRPLVALTLSLAGACSSAPDAEKTPAPPAVVNQDDDQTLSPLGREVAFQIPGRDLRHNPPKVKSMRAYPLPPDAVDANIRYEIEYDEPGMPSQLKINHNGVLHFLTDTGESGDAQAGDGIYTVEVRIPSEEIAALTGMAARGELKGARFQARKGGFEIPASFETAVVPTGRGFEYHAASITIDPARSLLINDQRVVSHPLTTADACEAAQSDATKEWMFGYLMTEMANQGATGVTPSALAASLLDAWSTTKTFNLQTLPPFKGADGTREPVGATVKKHWLAANGNTGTFLMHNAPFRLLAIVNRVDLRKDPRWFGEGNAGELRFVFGVLDMTKREDGSGGLRSGTFSPALRANGTCGDTPSTVILEYTAERPVLRDWATSWINLRNYTLGSDAYVTALRDLTRLVVTRGKASSRPNRSALIRIRTNESPVHDAAGRQAEEGVWVMREFVIDATTKKFRVTTVKQTPATMYKSGEGMAKLAGIVNSNATAIKNGTYQIPDTWIPPGSSTALALRGVEAQQNETITPKFVWLTSGVNDNEARHKFALGTCNGCHGQETGGPVFHVAPRSATGTATVSFFLTGLPSWAESIKDPVSGQARTFNEFQKRASDLASIVGGTATLQSVARLSTAAVH